MMNSINIPIINIEEFECESDFIETTTISSDTLLKALLEEVKFIGESVKNINENLDSIKERVFMLEKHNNHLGTVLEEHIGFINKKYETYKTSLDYVKDKVNYLTGNWFTPKQLRNNNSY